MTTRETLHCLIDEVPEEELEHVKYLLENHRRADRDPFLFTLATAPYDDEPETPEEAAAVAEAREDVKAGRLISREEARRRLLGRP